MVIFSLREKGKGWVRVYVYILRCCPWFSRCQRVSPNVVALWNKMSRQLLVGTHVSVQSSHLVPARYRVYLESGKALKADRPAGDGEEKDVSSANLGEEKVRVRRSEMLVVLVGAL